MITLARIETGVPFTVGGRNLNPVAVHAAMKSSGA